MTMLWDTAQCAFWPLGLLNVTLPCREAKDGEATRRSYMSFADGSDRSG